MNTQYEITDNTVMSFGIKILLIFAMLSTNFMSINKNTALAMPSLNGVGTQHTFGKNKGTPICGIYKISSPSGKIYVGQALNIYKRWYGQYRYLSCKTQIKLYRSLVKYGVENHKFEIIAQCEPKDLNELELYYIELYQACDSKNGLNLKYGTGKGSMSQETKDKIAMRITGLKRSENTKALMRKNRFKFPRSKKVINIKTGEIFGSIKEAAISIEKKSTTLNMMLLGKNKNYTNLRYYDNI